LAGTSFFQGSLLGHALSFVLNLFLAGVGFVFGPVLSSSLRSGLDVVLAGVGSVLVGIGVVLGFDLRSALSFCCRKSFVESVLVFRSIFLALCFGWCRFCFDSKRLCLDFCFRRSVESCFGVMFW